MFTVITSFTVFSDDLHFREMCSCIIQSEWYLSATCNVAAAYVMLIKIPGFHLFHCQQFITAYIAVGKTAHLLAAA